MIRPVFKSSGFKLSNFRPNPNGYRTKQDAIRAIEMFQKDKISKPTETCLKSKARAIRTKSSDVTDNSQKSSKIFDQIEISDA